MLISTAAVQAAFWGIFWNKGRGCVSAGSRLLVEESIYDEIVEKLTIMAKAAILGDPASTPKPRSVRLQPNRSTTKFLTYIESGKQSTARLTAGGRHAEDQRQGTLHRTDTFCGRY